MEQEVEEEEIVETEETLAWRARIRAQLVALGIPEDRLKLWDDFCVKSAPLEQDGKFVRKTPQGILRKYEEYLGDLTPEKLKEWELLPKKGPAALESLQRIKHPILCGWTLEEIIEASTPYLGKIVTEYQSKRSPSEDCEQQGKMGIILAIGTDAGIAPFADHAFRHIKTNIRRYAATGGVLRRSEKTPTKTEVKTAITAWLSGTLIQAECDRLASLKRNDVVKKILGAKKAHRFESLLDMEYTLDQAVLIQNGTIVLDQKVDLGVEIAELEKESRKIILTAQKNLDELMKITHLNTENLLKPEDFIFSKIQKIGHLRSCTCSTCNVPLVCESFPLDRLTLTQQMDLFDYLNQQFNPEFRHDATRPQSGEDNGEQREAGSDGDVQGWSYRMRDENGVPIKDANGQPVVKHTRTFRTSQHILSHPDSTQYQTVGDLIMRVAHAPDFHSETSPWSVPMEDGASKDESVGNKYRLQHGQQGENSTSPFLNPKLLAENKERQAELRELVERMRVRVPLTHEQEVVLIETWGFDGVEAKTGAFIADHFGKLVLMHAIRKQFKGQETICKLAKLDEGLLVLDTELKKQRLRDKKPIDGQLVQYFSAKIKELFKDSPAVLKVIAGAEIESWVEPSWGGVSRQRITQYCDAIERKFDECLFELTFNSNAEAINRTLRYVELSDLEFQVANLLFGLDGKKPMTFDEIIVEKVVKDLDVEPIILKLDSPHRREYMREVVKGMKKKLMSHYV